MANDQEGFNPPGVVVEILHAFVSSGMDPLTAYTATLGFLAEMIGFAAHMVAVDPITDITDETKRIDTLRILAEGILQAPQHPGLALKLEAKRAREGKPHGG